MAYLPEVEIWGSGLPKREFLFVDDLNEVLGYKGRQAFDTSKMDALGWKARTPLREGLQKVYCWFLTNNISKNNKS